MGETDRQTDRSQNRLIAMSAVGMGIPMGMGMWVCGG